MKIKRQIAIILTAVSISFQLPVNAAGRSPTASPTDAISSTSSMLAGKDNVSDGELFLRQLIDRVRNSKDYVYDSSLIANLKGKPVSEQGRFFFKSPNSVRFEVTSAKGKSGSVVVKQPDGKIRAKAGGLLGGITITLAHDSRMLRTANGFNILESDLVSLMQRVRDQARGQKKIVTTKSPTRLPGYDNVHIVELLNNDFVMERIIVDAARQVPIEWLLFEENKLDSYVKFSNLKLNSAHADELFYLEKIRTANAKGFEDSFISPVERLMSLARGKGEDASLPLSSTTLKELINILSMVRRQADELTRDNLKVASKLSADGSTTGSSTTSSDSPGGVFDFDGDSKPITANSTSESNTWSTDGRQVLLLRTASMESLMAPAMLLAKSFSQEGLSTDLASIGEQWRACVDNIDRSTSRLFGLLEEDTVDQPNVTAEARSIRDEADKLKALAERAYKLVD